MPALKNTSTPKPRRTAERILDAALAQFNRFGEPNVPMTALAAELGISPGNLYYHHASKEAVVDALFERYDIALDPLLQAAGGVTHVEDAWLLFHMMFELIWQYRFLYRDLNDLLSKNRRLEARFQSVLRRKNAAMHGVLAGLTRDGNLQLDADTAGPVATAMVVVLSYWLSYEYVRDPRHALEPGCAQSALARGAFHLLSLLLPYLDSGPRAHLLSLAGPYRDVGSSRVVGPASRATPMA